VDAAKLDGDFAAALGAKPEVCCPPMFTMNNDVSATAQAVPVQPEESLESLYEDAPCGYFSTLPDARLELRVFALAAHALTPAQTKRGAMSP
jgi:hypothetical protein